MVLSSTYLPIKILIDGPSRPRFQIAVHQFNRGCPRFCFDCHSHSSFKQTSNICEDYSYDHQNYLIFSYCTVYSTFLLSIAFIKSLCDHLSIKIILIIKKIVCLKYPAPKFHQFRDFNKKLITNPVISLLKQIFIDMLQHFENTKLPSHYFGLQLGLHDLVFRSSVLNEPRTFCRSLFFW